MLQDASIQADHEKNRGELMKTLKYGRLMGLGLGAGLAVAAVSSFIYQPEILPEGSATLKFQSLSEFHAALATPLQQCDEEIVKNESADLALNDSDIQQLSASLMLPPVDQMTAVGGQVANVDPQPRTQDDLTWNPELADEFNIALDAQAPTPNQFKSTNSKTAGDLVRLNSWDTAVPKIEATNLEEELSLFSDNENDQLELNNRALEFGSGSTGSPVESSRKMVPSNSSLLAVVKTEAGKVIAMEKSSESAETTWKKNPFLKNGGPVVNQVKNQMVPSVEISNTKTASTTVRPESSVLDFMPEPQLDASKRFSSPSSIVTSTSEWDIGTASKTDNPALAAVVATPIKFATPASKDGVSVASEKPNMNVALSGSDPYSVAPLSMALTESVAHRAVQHIEYGKVLAMRGASFAARQEFYSALRIVAQANDSIVGLNEHSLSLRRGILALKEAEDFVVSDTETDMGLNVAITAETHRAGVLTQEEAKLLTPNEAMQHYLSVAQEQIQRAVGSNVVSAEALYCLGKLHTAMPSAQPTAGQWDSAQAIVFHRAALASDQQHYRSANELGVLMARSGQMREARDLFKKSLRIKPVPQSWENLAKVHQRMNEPQLAQLAQSEFQRSLQMDAGGDIQWKPVTQFNADAPIEFHEAVASKPAATETASKNNRGDSEADDDKKSKSIGKMFKELF